MSVDRFVGTLGVAFFGGKMVWINRKMSRPDIMEEMSRTVQLPEVNKI
jgi:hypothetical protein